MDDASRFLISDGTRSRSKSVSCLRRSLSAGSESRHKHLHSMEQPSKGGLVKQAVAGLKKWRAHPLAFLKTKTRKKKEKKKPLNGSTSSFSQQLQVPSEYDWNSKYADISEEGVHDSFPRQKHHKESDVQTGKQAAKKNNKNNNLQDEVDKGVESPPAFTPKMQGRTESRAAYNRIDGQKGSLTHDSDEGPGIDHDDGDASVDDCMEELTEADEFGNDWRGARESNQGRSSIKTYSEKEALNLENSTAQAKEKSEGESNGGKLEGRRNIPEESEASTILPNFENIYEEAAGDSALPKKGVDKAEQIKEVPQPRHEHDTEAIAGNRNPRIDANHEHLTKQISERSNENPQTVKAQAYMNSGHDPSNHKLEDEFESQVKVGDTNDHSTVVDKESNGKARLVENSAVKPSHKKPADVDLNQQTDQVATRKETDKLKSKGSSLEKPSDFLKTQHLNLAESRNQARLQPPSNLYHKLEAQTNGSENASGEDLDFQRLKVCNSKDPVQINSKKNALQQNQQNYKAKQEGKVGRGRENVESAIKTTNYAVPTHDFCLGIPYGCLLIIESFLWLMATWNTSSFHLDVVLGGLVLALSISSLKAWSDGNSSRAHIKSQIAITCIILARDLPNVLKTKSFSSHALVCFISLAMICFYAHIHSLGESVKNNVKK